MIFRPLLSVAGKIYGFAANIRNGLYDRGIFSSADLGCRTISIGNITAGGTGKTPLVAFAANILTENGEKVCILTRGYGRDDENKRVLVSAGKNVLVDAKIGGDEPVELANKLIGKAIVIADANRTSAAAWARENFDISVFILDDGFQHRRAKRDVDIVLMDATNPFGGGMIPAGTLREPLKNLKRADAIIITRVDLVDSTDELITQIASLNPTASVFTAKNSIANINELKSAFATCELPQKVFAFCALGNPNNFFELLKRNNCDLVGSRSFRDHHVYKQSDADALINEAKNVGADSLLTTVKDAVKLTNLHFAELPVYVVEIEPVIKPIEEFSNLIIGTL